MFKILEAKELAASIFEMVVEAPRVAGTCLPGQFLIIRVDSDGERIPLTICDYDREKGTVEIVVQAVGAETQKLSDLKAGDSLADVVGPLGNPSDLVYEDIEELKKKSFGLRVSYYGIFQKLFLFYIKWVNMKAPKYEDLNSNNCREKIIKINYPEF